MLISESGEVRLADFGVAAARARPVSMINLDMEAVMATTFVGTPCWMVSGRGPEAWRCCGQQSLGLAMTPSACNLSAGSACCGMNVPACRAAVALVCSHDAVDVGTARLCEHIMRTVQPIHTGDVLLCAMPALAVHCRYTMVGLYSDAAILHCFASCALVQAPEVMRQEDG